MQQKKNTINISVSPLFTACKEMLGSSVVLKVMRCRTSEVFEEEKINKQPDKSGSGTASLCDITKG